MKIYVIMLSVGEYDDHEYVFQRAYRSKKKAEKFRDKYNTLLPEYLHHRFRSRERNVTRWNECELRETELI